MRDTGVFTRARAQEKDAGGRQSCPTMMGSRLSRYIIACVDRQQDVSDHTAP